tara:strand:+ start:32 stop:511 length:480 start_codon:yes stop_codon:yes gene_type:complete
MEKENKEKQYAWIVLREHSPASIDLSNSLDLCQEKGIWLQGFEWTVLTIENNRPERIHISDSFLGAKKWIEKKGYSIHGQNDDPSEMLIEAIYITTKKTVDEIELEKNISKLIQKAEDGITPYEPSVNDYDKCLLSSGEMKGRIDAFCEILKLLNKEND